MVSALISDRIEALDAFNHSQDDEESENSFDNTTEHIILGSKERPITFSDLEALHAQDSAFKDFRKKLNNFLNVFLPALSIPLPNNQRIQFRANDKVFFQP